MSTLRRTSCFTMLAVLSASILLVFWCRVAFAEDFLEIASDAYIYGYPLVTMDMTRRALTNVAEPGPTRAPMGQLIKLRTYPAVDGHSVTAPNADTLYTIVWLDVSKEPWVLSVPDMGDRYYLLPMLDGWSDVFAVPGKRTTGGRAQQYAITGPGWSGKLPDGVKELKSPTAIVWILGRIYCTGTPEDYQAVHELQDKFSVVPLSCYGETYTPPPAEVDASFDMKKAVRDQVDSGRCHLLQLPGAVNEGQSAGRSRWSDGGQDGENWSRSRAGIRPQQAWSAGRRACKGRTEIRRGQSSGVFPTHEADQRLGADNQDRNVWHRLYSARSDNGDRPGSQSSAGCDLSDLESGCERQALRWCFQEVCDALRQG